MHISTLIRLVQFHSTSMYRRDTVGADNDGASNVIIDTCILRRNAEEFAQSSFSFPKIEWKISNKTNEQIYSWNSYIFSAGITVTVD